MDMFTVVAEGTFDAKLDALIVSDTQGLLQSYDEAIDEALDEDLAYSMSYMSDYDLHADEADHYGVDYEEEDYFYAAPGWCDHYVVHPAHTYTAINGEYYSCSGFTLAEYGDLLFEGAMPPCEHGLSASLCSGPNHY